MTSGAIQKGVPTNVFLFIWVSVNWPATPKSASFTSPCSDSNTLAAETPKEKERNCEMQRVKYLTAQENTRGGKNNWGVKFLLVLLWPVTTVRHRLSIVLLDRTEQDFTHRQILVIWLMCRYDYGSSCEMYIFGNRFLAIYDDVTILARRQKDMMSKYIFLKHDLCRRLTFDISVYFLFRVQIFEPFQDFSQDGGNLCFIQRTWLHLQEWINSWTWVGTVMMPFVKNTVEISFRLTFYSLFIKTYQIKGWSSTQIFHNNP